MNLLPPPPPERLRLVRYLGRTRRPKQKLTRQLAADGVVDPVAVGVRKKRPPARFRDMENTTVTTTLTRADLDRLMPPKPADGPLAEAERAAAAVRAAANRARAEIVDIDQTFQQDAAALAALALAGGDIPQIETRDRALRRLELSTRLEILERAGAYCTRRVIYARRAQALEQLAAQLTTQENQP